MTYDRHNVDTKLSENFRFLTANFSFSVLPIKVLACLDDTCKAKGRRTTPGTL
jgi:hypothetical protein